LKGWAQATPKGKTVTDGPKISMPLELEQAHPKSGNLGPVVPVTPRGGRNHTQLTWGTALFQGTTTSLSGPRPSGKPTNKMIISRKKGGAGSLWLKKSEAPTVNQGVAKTK